MQTQPDACLATALLETTTAEQAQTDPEQALGWGAGGPSATCPEPIDAGCELVQTGEPPVTPSASAQEQQRLGSRLTPGQPTAQRRPSVPLRPSKLQTGTASHGRGQGPARCQAPCSGGVWLIHFSPPSLKKGLQGCALPRGAGALLTPIKPQLTPHTMG